METEEIQDAENTMAKNQTAEDEEISDSMPSLRWHTIVKLHHRRYLVNFLVIMFGIGAAVSLNGIGAQLPLLVISAPEGSALFATLAMPITLAFMCPAIYGSLRRSKSPLKISFVLVLSLLSLSTISMGFFAFFHTVTITINGNEHSIVIAILTFIMALVHGTRNVFLMPYVRRFEDAHLNSFFIGERLSGFFPSIVALYQGVGGEPICPNNTRNSTEEFIPYIAPPKFSSRDYFLFVFAVQVSSICAICFLEYTNVKSSKKMKGTNSQLPSAEDNCSLKLLDDQDQSMQKSREIGKTDITVSTNEPDTVASDTQLTKRKRIYFCAVVWFTCFLSEGHLFNMEAFSSRPYGNSAYHLVTNLCQLAQAMTCVVAYWLPPPNIRCINGLLGLVTIGASYVTWLGLSSPMPIWRGTTHGIILLILIWIVLMSLNAYVKFTVTEIVWKEKNDAILYQINFSNLSGSICSAIISYVFVAFTNLFTPYVPCQFYK